jgi:hypothetical protein
MTSILKVDQLQDSGGNAILTSNGAGSITTSSALNTAITNAGFITSGGITEADQWRLTTTVTTNTDPIINWERNDDSIFAKIGTGMSESSGIFTFPSTGLYLVHAVFQIEVASGDYVEVTLHGTTDNSTYDNLSYGGEYSSSGSTSGGSPVSCYVNVTDTSLVKVKFSVNDISAGSVIRGTTSTNRTWVDFIRLGDSQ